MAKKTKRKTVKKKDAKRNNVKNATASLTFLSNMELHFLALSSYLSDMNARLIKIEDSLDYLIESGDGVAYIPTEANNCIV